MPLVIQAISVDLGKRELLVTRRDVVRVHHAVVKGKAYTAGKVLLR